MCLFFIWNIVQEGKYQDRYFCFQMVMMAEIIVQNALLHIKKKGRAEQEMGGLILLVIFRIQNGSKLVGLNLLFVPAVLKLVQKNSTRLNETLIILIVLRRSSANITYLETRVDRQDVLHL